VVATAGATCTRCGSGQCARAHGFRHRKQVTDLSTGDVFHAVPIRRVRFCSGRTASLVPAELWHGRFTISSVIESVVHLLGEGIDAACEWTLQAGEGEAIVSPRTLQRWRALVRQRLVGGALAWLLPKTGSSWSAARPEASQLEALLPHLTGPLLAAFRATFGRGLLDTLARRGARRKAARRARAAPHDPSRPQRAKTPPCAPRARGSPPGRPAGGRSP
jgi:hypothetical protein